MQQDTFKKRGKVAVEDLQAAWPMLLPDERYDGFKVLPRDHVEEFFLSLRPADQLNIIKRFPEMERRFWIRFLPPHNIADVIQEAVPEDRPDLLKLLDETTNREVCSLLAYAEDDAGGLMSPDFIRLRPDMRADQAITYVKKQTQERIRSVYYLYVLDSEQKLLGVLPFRDLLAASPDKLIHEIMRTDVATVQETTDQEDVGRLLRQRRFLAIPVLDEQGRMKGIVTADTVLRVAEEEATEDIQKMGGTEVLDAPYFETGLFKMIRKRGVWLITLFLGEMFTATAMGYYEHAIERAAVLSLFIPLIISSGGNSGSQASTLIVRAMALGQVKIRDWFRVVLREIASGAILGAVLGLIGMIRILIWPSRDTLYGEHYFLVATTVAFSVLGVVLWGTIVGSMLPMLLRGLRLDPASASAPFVATLVDVTGLIIYFTMASLILSGTLL